MNLTDDEKDEVVRLVAAGQPLPDKYRWRLFTEPRETELIWPGKTAEVTNVVLPFQPIEQIDEPRFETSGQVADLFAVGASGRQSSGWSNKLIWGDNKLVLASLKNGPLRKQIEDAGGLKLVYIDPPFDVGADFTVELDVGDETLTKESSIIEDIAYRDTWGRGGDSFLAMLRERLSLVCDLLSPTGLIFVHMGWAVSHRVKIVMDEVFGQNHFMNQIIWKRQPAHSDSKQGSSHMGRLHDVIFLYSKSDQYTWNMQYEPYDEAYIRDFYKHSDPDGRRYQLSDLSAPGGASKGNPRYEFLGVTRFWRFSEDRMKALYAEGLVVQTRPGTVPRQKRYLDEMPGVPLQDLWFDLPPVQSQAVEGLGYSTQKPEKLLVRAISVATNPGDLVADFFCGSGTTLAVAEKLGRKWIGCDLGRFAIHTSRKRLIGVQRELKTAAKPYRAFEILNLGKYERQYFAGIDPTLPEAQRRAQSLKREGEYLTLILSAYKAERVTQSPPFHGKKGGTLICVGPVDAPVTRFLVREAVEAAARLGVTSVDCVGFEFEMGLIPQAVEEARTQGVRLALRYIPKDVFDKRAVEKGQAIFYDVAYVEVQAKVKGLALTVSLADFGVSYRQEDADVLAASMKNGGSKVTVDQGQVVKITKDKDGKEAREVLTKKWTDWIDYWSVDFDYHAKQEIITVTVPDASGRMVDRPNWTGGYIFENEWQSFRTRRDRTLELTSVAHAYPAKGKYFIAVKVIDIFGNDTTKVVEVNV